MAAVGWADSGVPGGQSQGPCGALAWQALTVPGSTPASPPVPGAWVHLCLQKKDQRIQKAAKCSCRSGRFPATFWAGLCQRWGI